MKSKFSYTYSYNGLANFKGLKVTMDSRTSRVKFSYPKAPALDIKMFFLKILENRRRVHQSIWKIGEKTINLFDNSIGI